MISVVSIGAPPFAADVTPSASACVQAFGRPLLEQFDIDLSVSRLYRRSKRAPPSRYPNVDVGPVRGWRAQFLGPPRRDRDVGARRAVLPRALLPDSPPRGRRVLDRDRLLHLLGARRGPDRRARVPRAPQQSSGILAGARADLAVDRRSFRVRQMALP